MKEKIALFLISLLTSFILFSTLSILMLTLRPFSDLTAVFRISIPFGFLCGSLFTVIVFSIQWFYLRKAGLKKNGISVVNSIEIEVEGDKEDIFALCLRSISNIKKCDIGQLNKDKGTFTVNVRTNWRTWGDVIQFEIKQNNINICLVKITSRPKMGTTLIDFGKNLENIIKITNFLKSKIEMKVIGNIVS